MQGLLQHKSLADRGVHQSSSDDDETQTVGTEICSNGKIMNERMGSV